MSADYTRDNSLEAVVGSVCQGPHGPYAVCYAAQGQDPATHRIPITVSLYPPVWKEITEEGTPFIPQEGHLVFLWDITTKVAGHRAEGARLKRFEDEVRKRKEQGG